MRPGQLEVLDKNRAYVKEGEAINEEEIKISGGGYFVLYRGSMTEAEEERMFRYCVRKALGYVLGFGSDAAVAIANHWIKLTSSRTNKN